MLLVCLFIVLAQVNSQYLNVTDNIGNFLRNPCTDKNHLVLAPGVLKAGGINRACISRFYPDGTAQLVLTLLTENRVTTTASRELLPGDGGCLDIVVPSLPNTKVDLIVSLQYPEAQCTWERRLSLRIASGRVLIVQTERARYRPGDTIRARVLALKPDLTPSQGSIDEVWLEGPQGAWEGTRVAQWLRLHTRLGLAQLQYQLDSLAPPGKWTLRAKLEDGSQGSAVFSVGHYELPPFQLSVRHSPRVLRTSERLSWIVCVRYPWSEAVEGILVIRLRGSGGAGAGVRTAVQLRAPKACHRHAVAAKRVGLHSENPPEVLVADFSFQEQGTRIWQNTTVVSQVVEKPLTLEFLTKHRAVISRGLPYKLKVKAIRWDDKPAAKEQVRVCRFPTILGVSDLARAGQANLHTGEKMNLRETVPESVTSHDFCADAETDANGVARVMFAAVQGDTPVYKFQAQLLNDSTTTASLTVRVRSGVVQAALGPLRADSRSSRTLVPLYINTKVSSPITVHFVVITRGGIIYRWGATTQCPTSNPGDQIYTAPRHYKCNDNYYTYEREQAQRGSGTASEDTTVNNNRPKRSSKLLNQAEIDPNTIPIETTIDPKITEAVTKTAYNRLSLDYDPNSIFKTNPASKSTDAVPNIWNRSDSNLKTSVPSVEELKVGYAKPSPNTNYQYHRESSANQSPKYNTVPRSSTTPFNRSPKTSPSTPKTNVPTAGNQYWTRPTHYSIPSAIPSSSRTTFIPFVAHQYWQNPSYINSEFSSPQRNIKIPNAGQWLNQYHTMRSIDPSTQKMTNLPNVGQQYWPHSTQSRIRSEDDVSNMTSDALFERKLKVMLPIKVSHQMCPDAHLIAYFYYNGELVSAAKHFEMDECFANKAEVTWLTRQTQPGSTVSLQVSSPGPAFCALTVLDVAAKWMQPPPTTRELLMNNLRSFIESHRNLTEYDAAGECFFNSDTPQSPTTNIELTSSWLASAGVRMLGGEAPRAAIKRCEASSAAPLISDDPTPRSDFSEAWLWRVLPLGANGTAVASGRAPDSITRFEAAATCLSKSGVAVAPPAVLQVFREFFIHADGPKRLRRGDSSIIRYRIFNYLYQPLSVQIQVLPDPHISVSTDTEETACIAARSSIARRVTLVARVASSARLSLRARTINDGHCPNVTNTASVSDEVIINMYIEHEGVPVYEQKSILLCANDSADHRAYTSNDIYSSTSQIEWSWPRVQAVPGTETLTLWTSSDMTGPLLADADSLVTLPRGCGEQNMAQLATNLLALEQLEPSAIAAFVAKEHVTRGFTRQLQYVHPSGGFSAFGASDVTSSTWLTAFAVKHLRKAHQLLWPNLQAPPALIRAERWLLNQQMENGCFRNEGQVFHRELRGGLSEEGEIASVALTAYVITSLLDNTPQISYRVLRNTLLCLRALPKSHSPTRVYAHALLAYAYMKIEKYENDLRRTNTVSILEKVEDDAVKQVLELLKVAKRSGGYVWWEASSLSTSIEATSYALLALHAAPPQLQAGGVGSDVRGALLWLGSHRSATGGFVSTQDTLVGLEALTAWSSTTTPFTHLNVTSRSNGRDQTVALVPGNKIPEVISLIPAERLRVKVQGNGCAVVQATRSYHTVAPQGGRDEKLLSVQVAVHTDGPFDCDSNGTNCYCAAVIETCVAWSAARFPEMALLEARLPAAYGADATLLYRQLDNTHTLLRRIELSPSSNRVTFYLSAKGGGPVPGAGGHECFTVHAVGPRTSTRPAYVRLLDYYVPEHNDTQLFTIPEDCPPRVTHDTPQHAVSDNLFDKARSLEGDEIIITNEFNFEDIPEGIPLEDPLYDNLTKREKYYNNNGAIDTENATGNKFNEDINTNIENVKQKTEDIDKYVENTSKAITDKTDINIESIDRNANIHHTQNVALDTFTLDNINGINITNTSIKNSSLEQTAPLQNANSKENNPIEIFSNTHHNARIMENIKTATTSNSKSQKLSQNRPIDNPNLADFHVIDTDKDLEVPGGVEGPVPSVVLPPKNFVPPRELKTLKTAHTSRGIYLFFEPETYEQRYFSPKMGFNNDDRHFKIRKNLR